MEMKGSTMFQPPWARYPKVCQSCVDPLKPWPNSAVPRTFGHVDGYISWELAWVTITRYTPFYSSPSRGTACLSVGSRMPWLVLSPQVSTKVRGYDKSIHKSNHTPISSTTGAGKKNQAHFPESGAGTGAAFWLLAGPPSVFRVQVWIEEPAAYNYKTTSGHWTSQTPLVFHVFTGKWSRTPQRRLWAKELQIRKLKGIIPRANFRSSHMILIVTYSANFRYSSGNTLRVLFRQKLHFAFISFDICSRYCCIFCTDPFTRTPKCM